MKTLIIQSILFSNIQFYIFISIIILLFILLLVLAHLMIRREKRRLTKYIRKANEPLEEKHPFLYTNLSSEVTSFLEPYINGKELDLNTFNGFIKTELNLEDYIEIYAFLHGKRLPWIHVCSEIDANIHKAFYKDVTISSEYFESIILALHRLMKKEKYVTVLNYLKKIHEGAFENFLLSLELKN